MEDTSDIREMADDLALRVCVMEAHGDRRYPDCPHPDCVIRRQVILGHADYPGPTFADLVAMGEIRREPAVASLTMSESTGTGTGTLSS